MLINQLIYFIALIACFIFIVPLITRNGVNVPRDRWFHGGLAVLAIGFLNSGLWWLLSSVTIGLGAPMQIATFGIIGWLVSGLAIYLFGKYFPNILHVSSYLMAFVAAIVLSVVSSFLLGHTTF